MENSPTLKINRDLITRVFGGRAKGGVRPRRTSEFNLVYTFVSPVTLYSGEMHQLTHSLGEAQTSSPSSLEYEEGCLLRRLSLVWRGVGEAHQNEDIVSSLLVSEARWNFSDKCSS